MSKRKSKSESVLPQEKQEEHDDSDSEEERKAQELSRAQKKKKKKMCKIEQDRQDDEINSKIGFEKLFKAAIAVFDPYEYKFLHLQELARVRATENDENYMKYALNQHITEHDIDEDNFAEFISQFEESGGNEQYEADYGTSYFAGISSSDFYTFAKKYIAKNVNASAEKTSSSAHDIDQYMI
jgi:hypothetical protein